MDSQSNPARIYPLQPASILATPAAEVSPPLVAAGAEVCPERKDGTDSLCTDAGNAMQKAKARTSKKKGRFLANRGEKAMGPQKWLFGVQSALSNLDNRFWEIPAQANRRAYKTE